MLKAMIFAMPSSPFYMLQLNHTLMDSTAQKENSLDDPTSTRTDIVTYHDSCQSCNCLGLRDQARRVIRDGLGLELREMPQSDVCCGFGGSTSIEHPEVAERLLNNKLKNAQSTGATVIVADNPG